MVQESDLSQRQVANLIKKRKILMHNFAFSSESSDEDKKLMITGNNDNIRNYKNKEVRRRRYKFFYHLI